MASVQHLDRGAGGGRNAGTAPLPRPTARPARKGSARPPRRSKGLIAASVLFALWAVAATWMTISSRLAVDRLKDEQVELRASYDDKVRALTRRLVGVASHQLLEQDGLAGRLADIIARQVELENRQSTLIMMADRLTGAGVAPRPDEAPRSSSPGRPTDDAVPAAPQTVAPPRTAPAVPIVPTLRLGGPSAPEPTAADRPPGPRSTLEPRSVLEPVPPVDTAATGRRQRQLQALTSLAAREQFDGIEASMSRLEGAQLRVLGSYARIADAGTGSIQTALAETGLNIAPAEPAAKAGSSRLRRKPPADPFDDEVARVEERFAAVQRWREIVDTVPFRLPLEGGGLTSNFGTRKDPFTGVATMHAGMDFRSPVGTPVKAPAAGRVIRAEVAGGYGNLVEIDHGHDVITRYGHLSGFDVSANQIVKPGMIIGVVGSTGRSTGPHLHYETRIAGGAVDPARFVRAGLPLFGRAADNQSAAEPTDEAPDD